MAEQASFDRREDRESPSASIMAQLRWLSFGGYAGLENTDDARGRTARIESIRPPWVFSGGNTLLSLFLALKRILIPIFVALAFPPTSTEADDGGYLGTVLEIGAANYVVQMDDGSLLDVEWDSGYDDWSRGDRVILTTESGGGYMYSDSGQTEVDVFPYNPADFGD
jgi:hypothetical protein